MLKYNLPWLGDRNYSFSHRTATTNLHPHLDKFHQAQYTALIEAWGWPNLLLSKAKEEKARQALLQVVATNVPIKQPLFTTEGLLNHLVWFIIANNQVSHQCSLHQSQTHAPIYLGYQCCWKFSFLQPPSLHEQENQWRGHSSLHDSALDDYRSMEKVVSTLKRWSCGMNTFFLIHLFDALDSSTQLVKNRLP